METKIKLPVWLPSHPAAIATVSKQDNGHSPRPIYEKESFKNDGAFLRPAGCNFTKLVREGNQNKFDLEFPKVASLSCLPPLAAFSESVLKNKKENKHSVVASNPDFWPFDL